MLIDLVIVNYFSADDLAQCLTELGPWADGLVWVVDNSNNPAEAASMAVLAKQRREIRLIVANENLGFGRACNLAFAQSSASLVLLLNPDARMHASSIRQLAQTLAANPQLGAVSPKTYWNPQKTFLLPVAHGLTPWVMLTELLMSWSPRLARQRAARYLATMQRLMTRSHWFPVAFLSGAALMVRRSAVVAAGGLFDPAYFMFYEDTDLSLRLRRAGYRLGIEPQAEAVHGYRHKPYKAPLMADSQRIYLQSNFPGFFWLIQRVPAVLTWGKKIVPETWFQRVLPGLDSPAELRQHTHGANVVALSPSPLGVPCAFRDPGLAPQPLSQSEWALLEPGPCIAFTRQPADPAVAGCPMQSILFHRNALPPAD